MGVCAILATQKCSVETFNRVRIASFQKDSTNRAESFEAAAEALLGHSAERLSKFSGTLLWQGRRIALRDVQEKHHVQELENSCVPAAVKNLIYTLTGTDITEAAIRKKIAEAANDNDHDFGRHGIDPVYALPVLKAFGVPSVAETGIDLDRLVQLAEGGRPLLIGIRKPYLHRLMLDQVTIGEEGEMLFHVRNSKSVSGLPYVMTRQEFEESYNQSAIIIVPI